MPQKCLPQAFWLLMLLLFLLLLLLLLLLRKHACMQGRQTAEFCSDTWSVLMSRTESFFRALASGIRFFNKNLQRLCIFVSSYTLRLGR